MKHKNGLLIRLLCLVLLCTLLPIAALSAESNISAVLAGMSDDALLELKACLDAELKSRKLDVSAAVISNIKTEDEPLVWIPKTGKKYHSSSTCSNMKQPKQVSLDVAKELGFTPCKKCNPPH